ncbi:MAG: alpha/beta fold hydrolase [Trueperaceae bacterium]|nr:MAG: alpha/beta fold hydrolase [Trueperaceae bacterium]
MNRIGMVVIAGLVILIVVVRLYSPQEPVSDSPPQDLDSAQLIVATNTGSYELAGESYAADVGTLIVPENWNDPGSRAIELPLIRIHATGSDPAEPIFVLEGGPGSSNIEWGLPGDHMDLSGLLERHDVVMVGYRGIDGSVSLDAPEVTEAYETIAENPFSGENLERLGQGYSAAFQRLEAEGVDIDRYTMIDVIDDLEAARTQLGIGRINLYSESYGTRVAYLYGLRYPDSLHRSALVAVNPPGHFVWEPEQIDAQLGYYAELWQQDADAVARSPDILATMQRVLATLPQEWQGFRIDPDKVKLFSFFFLFNRADAAQVFDAYVAAENGDYAGLAFMSVGYELFIPTLTNWGDRASKALSADFDPDRDYAADMNPPGSILGSPASIELGAVGSVWPITPIPEEYRILRESEVETLLINGSIDFSTPVESAQRLLSFLPNGELVILSEMGHTTDLATLQPEAMLHLLETFYLTGEVDASLFVYDPMEFTPEVTLQQMARDFVAQSAAPEQPPEGDVYEDPQGRFTMPLIGNWNRLETDGSFALFEVPGLDFTMAVLTVETGDLAVAEEAALRLVGVEPGGLTQTDTAALGNWSIGFYSQGGGQGVTPLCQEREGVSHCLVAIGDESLTKNPPQHVMSTIQAFTLAGAEVALPSTVEVFEAYLASFVGDLPPGLSMVITVGDEVIYAEGFGLADGPKGLSAAPDTVWLWGSMVKVVTATAIMQLVERGLIELDAPISEYLEYVPAEHGITVRQLLTHSAGLGEAPEFVAANIQLEGQPLPVSDRIAREYFEAFDGPVFDPGSASSYSNPGFVLLGQIVAEASGQPYIEYIQEHILEPLGMVNTGFTYTSEMTAKAAAPAVPASQVDGFIAQADQIRGDGVEWIREVDERHGWLHPYHVEAAHGGLIGPATEAIRFAQMHLNGGELAGVRILSPESAALMREMQYSSAGDPLGYGLAWLIGDGDHPYVEHDGGGAGLWDKMRIYPDEGVAIVMMSNGEGFDRDRVVDAAANVVFSLLAGPAQAPSTEAFTPPITDADGNVIPGSIATLEKVTLGGVDQWIVIRGADITKPVLLVLHGGPGFAMTPWIELYQRPQLEENFVVVHWDQRGAGKSYSPELTAENMTVANFVSDTLELTELLRERFQQDKIFMTGHSWGSALGFLALMENAEPYHAYIASAEAAHWNKRQRMSYEWVLEQARSAGDTEVIEALERLEPFDPTSVEHVGIKNQFLDRYRGGDYYTEGLWDEYLAYALEGRSPAYTGAEVENYVKGMELSAQTVGAEVHQADYDLFRDFPESSIPIHFFAGRHDHSTPGVLAEEYYAFLEAPAKSFIWFEDSGHTMMFDEPDTWAEELIRIANETLNE